ncbi:contractile injection system tape measure protein [Mycetohabitans endofungorum]|nr:contractile injection system tape measure protein [Mycetohabitans endofungorum]
MRPGTLQQEDGRLQFSVERAVIDILLNEVPWPLTQVSLSWLPAPISVT